MSNAFDETIADSLASRREADLLRTRRVVRPLGGMRVEIDGKTYVNFCSNDYLGLSRHPALAEAVDRCAKTSGVGSGGSGLICGHTDVHAAAEAAIVRWKGTDAAILLPSGYQANHAAIQTLAALGAARPGGVRFLIDKLVHASFIDAVRGTGAAMRIFPHNAFEKLERLLGDAPADVTDVVVTESIFSMDGDAADLSAIAELRRRHNFVLLLDEAHGSGVYGKNGAGYAHEAGHPALADVTVVTLSKALGVAGGAVCASAGFCEALVNFGRAYVYSTSPPPTTAAAAVAAIDVLAREPQRQRRVRDAARHVRAALAADGFTLLPGDSPIIPLLLGDERAALDAAESLAADGLLAVAVRPPTVPPGTSRLRVTLSSEHSDEEIDRLIAAVRKCARR